MLVHESTGILQADEHLIMGGRHRQHGRDLFA
jgi:hypothetical protein